MCIYIYICVCACVYIYIHVCVGGSWNVGSPRSSACLKNGHDLEQDAQGHLAGEKLLSWSEAPCHEVCLLHRATPGSSQWILTDLGGNDPDWQSDLPDYHVTWCFMDIYIRGFIQIIPDLHSHKSWRNSREKKADKTDLLTMKLPCTAFSDRRCEEAPYSPRPTKALAKKKPCWLQCMNVYIYICIYIYIYIVNFCKLLLWLLLLLLLLLILIVTIVVAVL